MLYSSRRFGFWAISAFALSVIQISLAHAQNKSDPIEIRLGYQQQAGGSTAIAAIMIKEKLIEKYAAQFGYRATTTWRAFPSGPATNEAMAAGALDIDMHMASLPAVSMIAAGVNAVPIGMVGSHISNAILVAPNSPIKSVRDLEGKRVGLVLGSSGHYLLASVVYYHFGKSIEDAGIKLISVPISESFKLPTGIDAAVTYVPQRYIGPHNGLSELLVDADGLTGKAYATPGIQLPEVRKSWAFPEGYNTDRLYAFAAGKFLAEHPDLVVSYLLAHIEAQKIAVNEPKKAISAVEDWWKLPPEVVEITLQTYAETAGIRNVPAILEWDVLTLIKTSEFMTFMKLRDKPLTWEELRPLFAKGAAVQKKAWELSGQTTSVDQMKRGFRGTSKYGTIAINGGAPVWDWATDPNWGKNVYIPGPFPTQQ
jgi:ABC-type nitrate/sulfonate/bicarbonate transport system substrate-binding protein